MEINNSRVLITGGVPNRKETAKQFIAKGASCNYRRDEKPKK
jgi:hypothetical protein